jgi:hypothetical protein
MIPGLPCVTLEFYDFPLDSRWRITEVTMGLTRIGGDMRPTNPVAVVGFDVTKAAEGTGHTSSHNGWKLNVKASRAKIIR